MLILLALLVAALGVVAAGCGGGDEGNEAAATTEEAAAPEETGSAEEAAAEETTEEVAEISGTIEIDGSSTVGPLTTAAAEAFQNEYPGVTVTVGISGSGAGFERFCAGETDISDASRPIGDDEIAACEENGIEYIEVPIAIDALTVVANSANDWADCLTVEQLNTIWAPEAEGQITNWNQVDPSYPDVPLVLAGPGTDSGTFDYFTDVINGEEGASRADYTPSEDDNVIVQAVEGDEGGLGYFGYSYYAENEGELNAIEIDGGGGCVAPSAEAAVDGSYTPLSRPLFIYLKKESFARPEVQEFVKYYIDNIDAIAAEALVIAPTDETRQQATQEVEAAIQELGG